MGFHTKKTCLFVLWACPSEGRGLLSPTHYGEGETEAWLQSPPEALHPDPHPELPPALPLPLPAHREGLTSPGTPSGPGALGQDPGVTDVALPLGSQTEQVAPLLPNHPGASPPEGRAGWGGGFRTLPPAPSSRPHGGLGGKAGAQGTAVKPTLHEPRRHLPGLTGNTRAARSEGGPRPPSGVLTRGRMVPGPQSTDGVLGAQGDAGRPWMRCPGGTTLKHALKAMTLTPHEYPEASRAEGSPVSPAPHPAGAPEEPGPLRHSALKGSGAGPGIWDP